MERLRLSLKNEILPVVGLALYAATYWCKPVRDWFERHGY